MPLRRVAGSAIFAFVFVLIPWPQIYASAHGTEMIDRTIYYLQIVTRSLRIDYFPYQEWLDYVTDEYLWGALLASTREAGFQPESVFNVISFCFLFFAAFFVVRGAGAGYLVLLVNPLVVDLAFSQLRLAAALSVLAIAWLVGRRSRLIAVLCCVLAPLVHTSAVLFLAIFLGVRLAQRVARRGKVGGPVAVLALTGLMLSLVTGPWRPVLLNAIEDRRAAYGDFSSSIAYLSFWLVLFVLLLLTARHWITNLEAGFAFAVLASVAFNLVLGGYSTRFLAAVLPLMVVAVARSAPQFRPFGVLAFTVYAILQWSFWLGLHQ